MKAIRRGAVATMLVLPAVVAMAVAAIPASAGVAPIAIGGRSPADPSISGGKVVWADSAMSGRGTDLYLYDFATRSSRPIVTGVSDQVDPDISGNIVAWTDYRSGNADIYALDLTTGIETPVAAGSGAQIQPAVSGTWVAWEDITEFGGRNVWARDLTNPSQIIGCDTDATNPRIAGNFVVYEKKSPRQDLDVRVYNVLTKAFVDVANGPGNEMLPDTDGRYVTWVQFDPTTGFDVYAFDMQTGVKTPIAAGTGEQTAPRISNGVVYYLDVLNKQIRLRAASAADGKPVAINTYGTGDVAGTDVEGSNVTWMEKTKSGWKVRALFNTPPTGLAAVISSARATALSAAASLRPRDFAAPQVTGSWRRALSPTSPAFVYFSERLNVASAVRGVKLQDAMTGRTVPARVRYVAKRRAVSVAPLAKLPAGSYQVVVGAAVRDLAGNTLAAQQVVPLGSVSAAAFGFGPGSPIASVVGSTGNISMTWNKLPGAVGYRVVRLNRPINAANFGSATQVASVTVPPVAIAPASDEASTSYTYYYAVYAVDSVGATSVLSANSSPDPHGARVAGYDFYSCMRCHTTHGGPAPGSGGQTAVQATNCYACHGSSSQAATYAVGGPVNVQAQFNDYSPAVASASVPAQGNGGWSIHRTSAMVQARYECEACHTPHRRPYYRNLADGSHGAAEAAVTYPKLLRAKTATNPADAYVYSTETTPTGNNLCFACHGTVGVEGSAGSLTSMILANGGDSGQGAASLDRTGGDHNSANWGSATLAHGTSNVPATPGGVGIQCEACHNNHAAASDKLLDWRKSATQTVDAYKQSKLCFECHTTQAGADETLSAGAKPYTWNGRDVKTEFARHSSHPAATAASGRSLTCYSCHNTHYVQEGTRGKQWDLARVSDPTNTKATPAATTDFCMDCHGSTAVTQGFARTWIAPYVVGTSTPGGTFPGWQKTMWTGSGHASATVGNGRAWCDNCHDPHASDFDRLVAWSSNNESWTTGAPNIASRNSSSAAAASNIKGTTSQIGYQESFEEALCLQCHGTVSVVTSDGVTIASKKAPGAANVATEMAGVYRHPTQGPSGRHSDTEGPAAYGLANRHAECVDCHDPHAAKQVSGGATHTVGSSLAGGALYGVFGVVPSYPSSSPYSASTTNAPSNFATPTTTWTLYQLDGGASDNEAYLCFKCHSSYTSLPTTVAAPARNTTPTNVAQEFNPQNFSFHNVVGAPATQTFKTSFTYRNNAGTTVTTSFNANPTTTNVFTGSWNFSSKMTCTDCHSNSTADAAGPHGSSVKFMIDPRFPGDWRTATLNSMSTVICAKCHNATNLKNANQGHSAAGEHQSVACVYCHIKVPHGWKRPRMIGYMSDPEPYASTWMQRIPAPNGTINFSSESNCYNSAGCGGKHSSAPATWWP